MMRQTETEEVLPTAAGRSQERPASVSGRQFRGRAGDGAECLALIDRNTIVLSRILAGMACRIRLTPAQYRGVAAVQRGDRCWVRLIHRDPGLTVDLTERADPDSAAEARDGLASLLAIPAIEHPVAEVRAAEARRPISKRLRRPRFLTRRKPGGALSATPIEGREIIAPE